jgi:hypothetical protein
MDKSSKAYKKAKREADKKFKEKTSAYKSMYITKKYKEYKGTFKGKKNKNKGLTRWINEKWIRIDPKTGAPLKKNNKILDCGRSDDEYKNNIKKGLCRPYIRITKDTPKTSKELSKKELKKRAELKKKQPGKVITRKLIGGTSIYSLFKPNLTPLKMFRLGSFGGTYWRPIKHKGILLENQHKKYNWNLNDSILTKNFSDYDIKINKYKVKVGTTLSFWRKKGWIKDQDPYGWVQWYCEYYKGRRSPDDERQIKRWLGLAGPNGRFRKFLITQIQKHNGKWNDLHISPKIRQTLQHWGYTLTKKDFDEEIKRRNTL